MQFAAVVVVLALASAIEASVIGWGPSLSVTGPIPAVHAAPAAIAVPGIATAWGHGAWGPGVLGHGVWGGHGAWAAPAAITAHAGVVPAVHAPVGHEGSYVAQTRGAVHVAPLAGHAHSAASINVHPAPGTV